MTTTPSTPESAGQGLRCPRCGSTNVIEPKLRHGMERWLNLQMILLVFGISAPDPGLPHYRCLDCKDWWMKKGYAG